MSRQELKKICDNVNEKANCHIKAGVSTDNKQSIVIYDSKAYDELFGHQVVGLVKTEEVETKYDRLKVEAEVLTKIAEISGLAIWTAVQKS
jgi:hypothetical protein